jgi:hypothetical protein
LNVFRKHWLWFVAGAVLRCCYIAFFMIMFLSMFQLTFGGAHASKALAGAILAIFLVGLGATCVLALWYRTRLEPLPEIPEQASPDSEASEKTVTSAWFRMDSERSLAKQPEVELRPRKTWLQQHLPIAQSGRIHPHDSPSYTMKFGWLASRFRRSKWWFFAFWLVYELVRAAFYGGAARHALTQVFGLLAWEIVSLLAIVLMRPFESNRLNLVMVYLLGFSKVTTIALASAFDERFGLDRIMCTVLGVVIIVIQGILTICLFLAITIGAISSYMSVKRYHETIKPRVLLGPRERYFAHINQKATDKPKPPPPPPPPEPERPKEPYFQVSTVRRQPKIEDDDTHPNVKDEEAEIMSQRNSVMAEPEKDHPASVSRTTSMRSRTSMSNLPYGARPHRMSWSTRDFQNFDLDQPSRLNSIRDPSLAQRASSLRGDMRSGMVGDSASQSDLTSVRKSHRRAASTPMGNTGNRSSATEEEKDFEIRQPIGVDEARE